MSHPTLFDYPQASDRLIGSFGQCHDCGGPLDELDALLPHTCDRDLACLGCCHACHAAALGRIMRRESPAPYLNAGKPVRGWRS